MSQINDNKSKIKRGNHLIVAILIKDEEGVEKERIYVGEKRLRTKTGKLGKLQTVYKWHNDAIKKFKEKGHTA